MAATIGTVTLPYGVQMEGGSYGETIAINNILMGSPTIQIMGPTLPEFTATATMDLTTYFDLVEQQKGSPMVNFNAGGSGDDSYGIIVETIDVSRESNIPNCFQVDISGYLLDFAVTSLSYDLSDGDYALGTASQLVTDNTEEVVDGYITRLVIKSTKECSFYVQTSTNLSTWTSYPDDIGWVLNNEIRVLDVSHVTGYLRVVADNTGGSESTINIALYMSKQQ